MALTQQQEDRVVQLLDAYQNGKTIADLPEVSDIDPASMYVEVSDNGVSKKMSLDAMSPLRGTAVELTTANAVLLKGQLGVESDTRKMKVGDGSTAWNDLEYIAADVDLVHKVRISLTIADGLPSDLIGVEIAVYDTNAEEYICETTWQGSEILLKLPYDKDVQIEFYDTQLCFFDYCNQNTEFTTYIGGDTTLDAVYLDNVVDLSMYTIRNYDNPTGRNTANCYAISEGWTYRFPLVYGNAIKDGKPNPAAYTPMAVNGLCHPFVDHNGVQITSPYIEETNNGAYTVDAAAVESSDDPYLSIHDVILEERNGCKYVRFSVGDCGEGYWGNARINVYVGGVIAWSWHIWYVGNQSKLYTQYTYAAPYHYMLMVPLGFHAVTDINGNNGVSLLYQWGRKDPLISKQACDSELYSGVTGPDSAVISGDHATSIEDSIRNPNKTYLDGQMWFGDESNHATNLWNAAIIGAPGAQDDFDTAIKTIYDPCPPMFMVPNGRAFRDFKVGYVYEEMPGRVSCTSYYNWVFFACGEFVLDGESAHFDPADKGGYWTYADHNTTDRYNLYVDASPDTEDISRFTPLKPDKPSKLRGIIPILEPAYEEWRNSI